MPEEYQVTIKQYMESLFNNHKRETDLQFEAMHKAVQLAREEDERRFHELNKLRDEVTTDREQFVTKLQFDPMMKERDAWREVISASVTEIKTRGNTWTVAIGLFFVVLQIALMVFLRK